MRNGYGDKTRNGTDMGIKRGYGDNKGEFRFRTVRAFIYLFGRSQSDYAKLLWPIQGEILFLANQRVCLHFRF